MITRCRAGFTLIELVVALLIAGMVVLLTHQFFVVVLSGARSIEDSRLMLDRQSNARRWMAAAWLSLEVGGDAGAFEGHHDHVEFASWTMTPGGWFTRGRTQLSVREERLVAQREGRTIPLAAPVRTVAFDYLLTPGAQSQWVNEWVSPASAPLAVRIRIQRGACSRQCTDTLLFLIGPRG